MNRCKLIIRNCGQPLHFMKELQNIIGGSSIEYIPIKECVPAHQFLDKYQIETEMSILHSSVFEKYSLKFHREPKKFLQIDILGITLNDEESLRTGLNSISGADFDFIGHRERRDNKIKSILDE